MRVKQVLLPMRPVMSIGLFRIKTHNGRENLRSEENGQASDERGVTLFFIFTHSTLSSDLSERKRGYVSAEEAALTLDWASDQAAVTTPIVRRNTAMT